MTRILSMLTGIILLLSLSGCGLFLGRSSKVDNKSYSYEFVRLDREFKSEWRLISRLGMEGTVDLTNEEKNSGKENAERGDAAFEHKVTGSIISVNSVCREYQDTTLLQLSKNLHIGLGNPKEIARQEIKVDGTPALETTLQTKLKDHSPMKVRTVVLRKTGCTYDLMFISRPEYFDHLLQHFDLFLKGFHAI